MALPDYMRRLNSTNDHSTRELPRSTPKPGARFTVGAPKQQHASLLHARLSKCSLGQDQHPLPSPERTAEGIGMTHSTGSRRRKQACPPRAPSLPYARSPDTFVQRGRGHAKTAIGAAPDKRVPY